MSNCGACGGTIKMGLHGRECTVCGSLLDARQEIAPCGHGVVVAGKNKCHSINLPDKVAGEVYSYLIEGHECPMNSSCPGFKVAAPSKDAPKTEWDNWDRAKEIVVEQQGKGQDDFEDQDWGLVTHIWKGMKGHHPPKGGQALPPGVPYCRYLDTEGHCVQPYFELDAAGNPVQGTEKRVSLGMCPFADDSVQQKWCEISDPAPNIEKATEMFATAQLAPVMAHWVDVRNKALRIRRDGGVRIVRNDKDVVVGSVRGDHGDYISTLYRQDGGWSITTWECTCDWGSWAFKRRKYFGRMCAHAYATLMQAQAEKMTGPGSLLYQHQYTASIKEGTMAGDICSVCEKEAYHLVAEPLTEQNICIGCMDSLARQAAVRVKLGSRDFEYEFLKANLSPQEMTDIVANTRIAPIQSGRLAHVTYHDGKTEVISLKSEAQVEVANQQHRAEVQVQPPVEVEVEASASYDVEDEGEIAQLQKLFANNPDFQEFRAKTATRDFSFSEQQELLDEGMGTLARNIDRVRTDGTHFDSMTRVEDEDSSGLFM